MNLILLFESDFIAGNLVRLSDRRMRHIMEVHRASVGDELCVGLEGGDIGSGVVTILSSDALEMEVQFSKKPPPKLPLTLVLAMPRPKVFRRVLYTASALGVGKIFLINSRRVEKSFWKSPVLDPTIIRRQLILGLEQSRDTIMPEVLIRPLFKPFVEDDMPQIMKNTLPLVAHPAAQEILPRNVGHQVTLAVGPEGGFIPYEIDMFRSLGFRVVGAGERILPVEAAVPFLISRLL
ncbi:MAG: 16S rRNA (uracil(1498)-N(3))-methyltransferase [Nitrospirae bacterium]|nr:16S rRNA (uracil(1498)-N(3))-methyltransferase [Nitrospirota bacterium]